MGQAGPITMTIAKAVLLGRQSVSSMNSEESDSSVERHHYCGGKKVLVKHSGFGPASDQPASRGDALHQLQ